MNRRQAVVFKMMYGWDNLSSELQTGTFGRRSGKDKVLCRLWRKRYLMG